MSPRLLLVLLLLPLWAARAWAGPAPRAAAGAEACATGGASSAPPVAATLARDGSLELSDGRRLTPAGIVLPTALRPDPALAARSAAAVAQVLDGHFLQVDATQLDRHGRLVGGARLSDDPSAAQGASRPLVLALLEAGAGYADPRGAPACADQLLAAEAAARRQGRGIFATEGAIVAADDAVAAGLNAGLFTLVEGRVSAAGATRQKVYLNFGPRWRDDFTVILAAKDFATILSDDRTVAQLRGAWVQVRGVVREEGGPAIQARAHSEISVLTGPHAAVAGKGEDK